MNNNYGGILENLNTEIMKKEEEKKKHIERIENEINIIKKTNSTGSKETDFDNCNIYLKPNLENDLNNANSRKRSAMRFIENTLDKTLNNQTLTNSTKSTKDPINDKISSINSIGNIKPGNNNYPFKNSITSTNALNNQPEKKEFQSRRKNQTNNILNDLDNPRVVDINLNTNLSNKSEIDKNDHNLYTQQPNFRKINNYSGNNLSNNKDMIIADNPYTNSSKKELINNNSSRASNNSNSNNNINLNTNNNESGLGLFNSRRHITNTNTLNNLTNTNLTGSIGNNNKNTNNKDKQKFLII
jgi:hypothetical protein